jgi:Tetratricopeptide repeat
MLYGGYQWLSGLNNLATLLQATNRLTEAEPPMRRALAIDEKSFGPEHPNVARDLNNLARLLHATNRRAEAKPLMRRALAILVASLGADHPNSQMVMRNYTVLLGEMSHGE